MPRLFGRQMLPIGMVQSGIASEVADANAAISPGLALVSVDLGQY